MAVLTVATYGQGLRARMLLGGLAGAVLYGTTLGWLTGFAVAGYVAIAALETVMLAVVVGLMPAARDGRWAGGWWALPAALVLLDAAQTRFPFDGFPLPALVHGQLDGPFVPAAPLGGSLLVTAVAATAGVGLAALVLTQGRARLVAVGTAVAVAGLPVAVGATVTTVTAGDLDVAVVQGGGPRGLRAVFTDPQDTTDRQFAVAEQITGSPDLVLLPETVISVDGTIAGSAGDARTAELARRLGAPVVVGVVENQGSGFRNAAVLWGPAGAILGRYEKEHRVPFGEYIPGRELLSRVTDLTALVPRDAIAGEGPAVLESPAGPLGVVISYEVLFADRVRETVTAGGTIVLVPTNAASYLTEDVPAIEVAGARLRALEYGRTVLQSAPTGYSVVVTPDGRVLAQSGLGAAALLRETVPLRTGFTPQRPHRRPPGPRARRARAAAPRRAALARCPVSEPEDRPAGRSSRIGGPLVLLLAAASFGVAAVSVLIPSDAERELASFAPTAEQPDPSTRIPGIVVTAVTDHAHAAATASADPSAVPPVGGGHGPGYAACDGVAHPEPLAAADAVHAMERGAVWITYDPARTAPNTVQALAATRVTDGDFLMMSPYPGLDVPFSLQAWGHRLTLDTPDDPRFEQFIRALSDNPNTAPLPDAGCAPGS